MEDYKGERWYNYKVQTTNIGIGIGMEWNERFLSYFCLLYIFPKKDFNTAWTGLLGWVSIDVTSFSWVLFS